MSSKRCLRIFSGIQPTGIPHLGNYFGAIARWIKFSNDKKVVIEGNELDCETPVFSIVDVHAYSAPKPCFGSQLYHNILSTTASLLALGLDPNKCILYRQSDLFEHNYLENVLNNFVNTSRLKLMTQFKEKSKESNSISNGLLTYPILQTADILLHRANLVPVGEDQVQHIELCRDIAKKFNHATNGDLFPLPQVLLDESLHSRRIKSLRDPEKKMSKSDKNMKSIIEVIDEPDVIVEKCKKSLTDCISAIYYDPENRPGVSNLMRIYHLLTGNSFEQITDQFRGQETVSLKLRLADILIDKFQDTRSEYKRLMGDNKFLEEILQLGKSKAKPNAMETIENVKYLLGSYRS